MNEPFNARNDRSAGGVHGSVGDMRRVCGEQKQAVCKPLRARFPRLLARATPASGFLEAGYPDCSQDEPTVLKAIGRHGNAQWPEHTEFGVRWRARSSHPGLG